MVLDSETIGSVRAGVKGYFGFDQPQSTDLSAALTSFVSTYGVNALLNTEQLRAELRAAHIPEMDNGQACLLTKVRGFKELLQHSANTKQLDLDRFVYNAVSQTGLTRGVVLRLTADFAQAAGYERLPLNGVKTYRQDKLGQAFVVPWGLYADDLKAAEENFLSWKNRGAAMTEENLNRLRMLNLAGIPEAQYCLGYYLLRSAQASGELNTSLQVHPLSMLRAAADAGERRAAAALGDHYYENGEPGDWEKAFEYYIGYGSLALETPQRAALVDIINHKTFNRKVLSLCAGLLALIVLSVLAAPGTALYAGHFGIGILCCFLCGGTLAAAFLHHRAKPYDDVYYAPAIMFLIWMSYLAARLLF